MTLRTLSDVCELVCHLPIKHRSKSTGLRDQIDETEPPTLSGDCARNRSDYTRRLADELDLRDLIGLSPPEPMCVWPISRQVNRPKKDNPSIIEPMELAATG